VQLAPEIAVVKRELKLNSKFTEYTYCSLIFAAVATKLLMLCRQQSPKSFDRLETNQWRR